MSIGLDTCGFKWRLSCATLLLAALAGFERLGSTCVAGWLLWAGLGGVVAGIAAAAHMRVASVAALATGWIVDVKAESLGTARLSQSIFSSKLRSTGLEIPKGEAISGYVDSVGGGTEPVFGAHKATKALLIDSACLAYLSRSTHSVTWSVKHKLTSQIKFGSLSSASMSARKRCRGLKYRTCTGTTISSFGKLINVVSHAFG